MGAYISEPRKHTRFVICQRHSGWFAGKTRYRTAECFAEGGPGGMAGCRDGLCRIWPGRDFFIEELCYGEMELDWTRAEAVTT